MAWLLWTSFRRNWFRYWLAVVGLAAAVAVACVGISGSAMMWRMYQYPLLQVTGGDLMILDGDVRFLGSSSGIWSQDEFRPMSLSGMQEFVHATLPGAKMNGTMMIPVVEQMRTQLNSSMVLGRDNETDEWIYSLTMMMGRDFLPKDDNTLSILVPGSRSGSSTRGEVPGDLRTIRISSVDEAGELGELAAATAYPFEIVGVYQQPSHGNTVMPISTLQRLTGVSDQIHWAGVAVPNPLALAESKATIEQALAEQMPSLQVYSSDDLAKLMIADFDRLDRTAAYYTPVMILASVLVVVVTALAISHSRRRELVLLRTVGVCATNVRALFVAECTAVAALGSIAGTVVSLWFGASILGGYILNLVPGIAAMMVTLLVAFVVSGRRKGKDFAELLRNP